MLADPLQLVQNDDGYLVYRGHLVYLDHSTVEGIVGDPLTASNGLRLQKGISQDQLEAVLGPWERAGSDESLWYRAGDCFALVHFSRGKVVSYDLTSRRPGGGNVLPALTP